ncbi:unnamed protein product [Chrysoparadoxa australica]
MEGIVVEETTSIPVPAGQWLKSARNWSTSFLGMHIQQNVLNAELKDSNGQWHSRSVTFNKGDIFGCDDNGCFVRETPVQPVPRPLHGHKKHNSIPPSLKLDENGRVRRASKLKPPKRKTITYVGDQQHSNVSQVTDMERVSRVDTNTDSSKERRLSWEGVELWSKPTDGFQDTPSAQTAPVAPNRSSLSKAFALFRFDTPGTQPGGMFRFTSTQPGSNDTSYCSESDDEESDEEFEIKGNTRSLSIGANTIGDRDREYFGEFQEKDEGTATSWGCYMCVPCVGCFMLMVAGWEECFDWGERWLKGSAEEEVA